jgi:hypothetical protein
MLRCASSLVVATYEKVGLTPHDSRALPLGLFTMSLDWIASRNPSYNFVGSCAVILDVL